MSQRVIRTTRVPIHATIDGERREIGTVPVHYLAGDDSYTIIPPDLAPRFQDNDEDISAWRRNTLPDMPGEPEAS